MEKEIKRLGPGLLEAFKEVPDPRSPLGRRHPLAAILSLLYAATPFTPFTSGAGNTPGLHQPLKLHPLFLPSGFLPELGGGGEAVAARAAMARCPECIWWRYMRRNWAWYCPNGG